MENFSFRNVSFAYPEQENKALRDISFDVSQGEFLILCGPSGCGKSTLLRHLKTCRAPHGVLEGEILFDGKALKEGVDYTAREGSTVVTVKSETMEALSDGAHTAAVQFDNGTAEVKLTVQKAADSKPPAKDKDTTPKTGDTNDTAFHVILIVAAAAAIAAVSAALPAKRKQSGK